MSFSLHIPRKRRYFSPCLGDGWRGWGDTGIPLPPHLLLALTSHLGRSQPRENTPKSSTQCGLWERTGSGPLALAQSRRIVGAQRGHPALSHPTPILQGCGAILEHLRAQSARWSVDICGGPTVCYGWTGASFLPHGGRGRNPHGGDGGLARGHQGGGSLGNHVSTEGVSSDEEDSGSKRGGLRRNRRQV